MATETSRLDPEQMKIKAAKTFFDLYIATGKYSTIGLGTGTTVEELIPLLGKYVSEGHPLSVVPTSERSSELARKKGITVLDKMPEYLDIGVDGADEIDPCGRVIKGNHGAMVPEKKVAEICRLFVVMVGNNKLVKRLGEKFAIPVEVPEAHIENTKKALLQLGATGCQVRIKPKTTEVFKTEAGNPVIDARFDNIPDRLEKDIDNIPHVIGNGLFITQMGGAIVAYDSGTIERWTRNGSEIKREVVT